MPAESSIEGSGLRGCGVSLAALLVALLAIGTGLRHLDVATAGLEVSKQRVGEVPVTLYRSYSFSRSPWHATAISR